MDLKKTFPTLLFALATPLAFAGQQVRIKVATVADHYTPTNATVSEPVSLEDFHFEVNPEMTKVRLVVEYSYPDQIVYQKGDDKRGPQPSVVQLPGLKYIPEKHAVVYDDHGNQTVCAYVQRQARLLHHGLQVRNTGACKVSSEDARHADDDGWKVRRFNAIDTYFEVH